MHNIDNIVDKLYILRLLLLHDTCRDIHKIKIKLVTLELFSLLISYIIRKNK